MSRWSAPLAALAIFLAAAAALTLTPDPDYTPAAGLAGWPRLVLYAAAGVMLALTAAPVCLVYRLRPRRAVPRSYWLLGLGVAASVVAALVNAQRLRTDIADELGPALWIISMLLLLGYSLFPLVQRIGWASVWAEEEKVGRYRWLAPLTLVLLVAIAAAIRLSDLANIPQGINPDEGDRASTSLDVLKGLGPSSWFESGWFFINMVYFRVLALSLAVFGPDVAGGRMLTALLGIAFVGVIAWIGWRNFGARVGLVAAAFATGIQMAIQYSRLITEAGPTGLLWALSIGGFLEGARTGRAWAWVLAGLTGGLSLYFYPAARLWAIAAVLTVLVLLAFLRDRRMLMGIALAAVASVVAALPFLIHLSQHTVEVAGRYDQTAVLDPHNQERLAYLTPPEALPHLAALQIERTVGMFDRYPDGGGFLPTGHPLFNPPLAQLVLVGAVYLLVRGWRDVRLAVLSIWFWVGLSGVALTVETPNYLRAVGLLPSLCFVLAIPLLDLVDRCLSLVSGPRRAVLAGAVPAMLAVVLLVPEVDGYFVTFRTMPSGWAPETHEGQVIEAMGASGPVYSLELNEHLVNSGWVRLLAPTAERGRVPNPGSELPFLRPPGTIRPGSVSPEFFPTAGQGFSVLLSPDPSQLVYIPLLQQLYPQAQIGDGGGDQRTSVAVSSAGLTETQGVTLVPANGASRRLDRFGDIPADLPMPADLTWRAGVRLSPDAMYQLSAVAPAHAQVRVDGISVLDTSGPGATSVEVAEGLHFVELDAHVTSPTDHVGLAVGGNELSPQQTYSPMDAPWGLLARIGRPFRGQDASHLDATVAMAFFSPELGPIDPPNSITWSGTLLVPRSGTYRMAFAAEDLMHLRLDDAPVDVVTVGPDAWRDVGMGSTVPLTAGAHRVQVTLDVTHGGRNQARWNWVPPKADGAVDPGMAWSVVPPSVLRPETAVRVVP